MYFYKPYGLTLCSDFPLKGFPAAIATESSVDLHLIFGSSLAAYAHRIVLEYPVLPDSKGVMSAQELKSPLSSVCFHIRYPNGLEFGISGLGTRIHVMTAGLPDTEDFIAYLAGPILGFALRLQGYLCLHASVVAIGGYAIALMAPSGAGKSTTAAAISEKGFPILSDDLLVVRPGLDGQPIAQPGPPWLRLCDDALPALEPETWGELDTTRQRHKHVVSLPQRSYQWADSPLPLLAIYSAVDIDADIEIDIVIETLTGSLALARLLGNLFPGPSYPLPQTHRVRELATLHRLMTQVPLRGIAYRRQISELPALRDALIADAQSLADGVTEAGV